MGEGLRSVKGEAKIYKGKLVLKGHTCVKSKPLPFLIPADKTIIAWFQTYDLSTGLNGSPATLRAPNGDSDGILYSDGQTWRARTLLNGKLLKTIRKSPDKERSRKRTIMIATVYSGHRVR